MAELLRRLRYLWNRRRLDQELAGEMEVHREIAEQEGGTPFGNTLRLREESRDAWGWTWIERLLQDLRYAARILRKSPGFTLAAVLMLALGIGVNIAAFGFFNLMVLKPLPIRTPETLMRFERRSPQSYASTLPLSGSRILCRALEDTFRRARYKRDEAQCRWRTEAASRKLRDHEFVQRSRRHAKARTPARSRIRRCSRSATRCRPQLRILAAPLRRRPLHCWKNYSPE